MASKSKGRDRVLSALDALITALNLAKDSCPIAPAQIAFGSASVLLTVIRDSTANKHDYVELGKTCAGVCEALNRGLNGRRLDDLSKSVLAAIEQLTVTLAEIQRNVVAQGERNVASRLFHSRNDKDAIAAWRQDLNRILQIFSAELLMNNHVLLLDIHRNTSANQQGTDGGRQSTQPSAPLGELPPQPPRVCFGREELVENIVGLAENLTPIALIGAGGIGKTSIALTVLHHDRIKHRFGDNRRFIRCDQFPASRAHFLAQLSKAIGAGIEHPEDLASLQRFLSSRDMILFLDNAESILDPQGAEAEEIHAVVEELSRFSNICLGITSRISTIPPHSKRLTIPTLSMESACDIFYNIYGTGQRSDIINDLIRQLDFHALSITLLATTASHNMWDHNRLAKEWDEHQVRVLRADYNKSLAKTIELSLTSPTFCKLGPDAHDLLGVIAFFPQGVNEDNLDWLFPTIPDRRNIFDKFCLLSLTSRSNGFTPMLAPIRDYLLPQDPKSSPLLCATKDHYFRRLSVQVDPAIPGFGEARWIVSEDVNVEHLLDVFTSIDPNSPEVWDVCGRFFQHLYWHKPRQTVLREKIKGLPDDHGSKPRCLFELARLFDGIGNEAEEKQLLAHALRLERKREDDTRIALTLNWLADANRQLGLHKEGIQQAKEALGIYERLSDKAEQACSLTTLAWLLLNNKQFDAAEEAATRAIASLPEEGQEFRLCRAHRLLGSIYRSKRVREKAIHHFQTALGIASVQTWHDQLFWIHYELAWLFRDEDELDDAHDHVEQARSHAIDDAYNLGCSTEMHARIWYRQGRLDDARSEALRAIEIYEKIGASKDIEDCKNILGQIEDRSTNADIPGMPSILHTETPLLIPG